MKSNDVSHHNGYMLAYPAKEDTLELKEPPVINDGDKLIVTIGGKEVGTMKSLTTKDDTKKIYTIGSSGDSMSLFNTMHVKQQSSMLDIKSYELENVQHQEITIPELRYLFDIQFQGDGIYLYYCVNQPQPDANGYIHPTQDHIMNIWIFRNGDSIDRDAVKGNYVKTIVIKDVAYHFFSDYKLGAW